MSGGREGGREGVIFITLNQSKYLETRCPTISLVTFAPFTDTVFSGKLPLRDNVLTGPLKKIRVQN